MDELCLSWWYEYSYCCENNHPVPKGKGFSLCCVKKGPLVKMTNAC
jgi:hypothetical protein